MARANEKIRFLARDSHVTLWEIANHLGVSEPTMTRWMRTPLPREKEKMILKAIDSISCTKKEGN